MAAIIPLIPVCVNQERPIRNAQSPAALYVSTDSCDRFGLVSWSSVWPNRIRDISQALDVEHRQRNTFHFRAPPLGRSGRI